MLEKPSEFPAATKVDYSETNLVLAGLAIEKAAKKPLAELVEFDARSPAVPAVPTTVSPESLHG